MRRRADDEHYGDWYELRRRVRDGWERVATLIESWLATLELAPQRGAHDDRPPRQRPETP